MVICLERGTDVHTAQLMPLPLTVSCFGKIQIGFSFLVLAHLGSPGKRAVKRVCVCVCLCIMRQYYSKYFVLPRRSKQNMFDISCRWGGSKSATGSLSSVYSVIVTIVMRYLYK